MSDKSKENIETLLSNKEFIDWVLFPSKESDHYWTEKIQNDSELSKDVAYLKSVIGNLQTKEYQVQSIDQNEVWNVIKRQTIENRKENSKVRKLTISIAVSVAASIAVLLVIYVMFSTPNNVSIDYNAYLKENQVATESKDIELVLADNKKISIEEDTVDLVYDKEGRVLVNTQNLDNSLSSAMNQLFVPYGKSSTLILSDGTKVNVNAGTRLIYPAVFNKDKREIYVDGEIFLNVVKDKDRPFVVKTSELEVKVLGTSFNVSAYSNIEKQAIVLVEGAVTIKSNLQEKAQKLQPNQMYQYSNSQGFFSVETVDASNHIAWIYGYMLFDKTPLDEVLIRLTRYYNVQIKSEATTIKDITITGKLDLKTDIEEILKSLKMIAPISYHIDKENKQITLRAE